MAESKKRRKLAGLLGATVVTSRDKGDVRRFKSAKTGLWGCCTNNGEVVLTAGCTRISHFCPDAGFRVLTFPGEITRRVDSDFLNVRNPGGTIGV